MISMSGEQLTAKELNRKSEDLTFRKSSLATSSSIDFPEEDGAPEGFDARAILGKALQLARV